MADLTFHRTFALSRPAVAKVVLLARDSLAISKQDLERTDLGTVYQEAMPRYAYRAGLLDKRRRLTLLGKYVAQFDPYLERLSTQWLLHYHLAAPHGPTAFWHELVCRYFRPGGVFTADDLVEVLTAFITRAEGKTPKPRSVRSTVTVFVGTYLKSDGLGRLGLLKESDGGYRVAWPDPPPMWAFAYALVDYWQARYGQQLTANLDDFTGGALAAVFLQGADAITELLLRLKREGLVDVYRTAHPYQLVLLQLNPESVLQQLYDAGARDGHSDAAQSN